ncbi:8156_t:CDS:2, partial [Acaulospora morrowiae]
QKVKSGDFVSIQPEHVMTHDNTAVVMSKFKNIGAKSIKFPRQPVFTLDHNVQDKSEKNLAKYDTIEKFAETHNVDFYPAGRGIGHQIVIEEGYAFPYTMTVASDSHSNMYGGIGCLGTPIVRTDAAAIWATGKTWWQIPPVVKVEFKGQLPSGVTGKDVIITLCGMFNKDEVLNCAIEFTGEESIRGISIEDRLAISNMTTEWGALVGLFPVDDVTIKWLRNRVEKLELTRFENKNLKAIVNNKPFVHPRINHSRIDEIEKNPLRPSVDSYYAKHLTLDLSTVTPYVSGPNSVKVSTSLAELEKENIAIHKAYLVSCVNSRAIDLKAAAEVIKGRKVADGVEFYIAAASSEVQNDAEKSGDWQTLVDAGAKVLPPGCLGTGLLKDGEVGISATNRNFKGRMGSPSALAYLASPAVVAASAVAGKVASPAYLSTSVSTHGSVQTPRITCVLNSNVKSTANKSPASFGDVIPGFPETIKGQLLYCHADNLNTDGIYPGKYTYMDELTFEDMAKVVMENYDPKFSKMVTKGDILVGGFNFGSGSSREQAAVALKACGITLVLAGSFSETFKRNSINNALLCLEAPELVYLLREIYKDNELTTRTNLNAEIKVIEGKMLLKDLNESDKLFNIGVLGRSVQELWVAGGLENWVRQRI